MCRSGGPAGAFIVIVYGMVERYGLANLLMSTILAGGLLFAMGLLKLGTLVRYIPVSIVIGFTNGIAVLIALSQFKDVLGLSPVHMPADAVGQIRTLWANRAGFNPWAMGLAFTTVTMLFAWPRLFQAQHRWPSSVANHRAFRAAARMPGPVIALVILGSITHVLGLPVQTIGTRFGGIPRALPVWAWPDFSWEGVRHLFIPTLTIAVLGAIESLLCARVADNMTEFKRHDPNQELMAQGVANMVAPFFGGIPATGTIARTVTNVRAGATSPVAGIVHALALLIIVLVAAPLAALVPLPVLAGILLFAAWNMGEWHELVRLKQFNFTYRTILLGTFFLTVVFDLTVAVEAGLLMACLFFIYRMSTLFRVDPVLLTAADPVPVEIAVYQLHGALFFGAVGKVEALPEQLPAQTRVVVLGLERLVAMDTSGLDALVQLRRNLERQDRTLVLCDLHEQPLGLIRRSRQDELFGQTNLQPTLVQGLARARSVAGLKT